MAAADAIGEVGATQQRCARFLPNKNRKCTVFAKPGSIYCAVHQPCGENAAGELRLPCPFGNHTVCSAHIERHLRLCPDAQRRPELHFAYSNGFNMRRVSAADGAPISESRNVDLLEPSRVSEIFAKGLLNAANEGQSDIVDCCTGGSSEALERLEKCVAEGKLGGTKHSSQRLGLVRVIDKYLVQQVPAGHSFGFVEFGAGKAGLSLALRIVYPDAPLILVDKDRFRDCKDKIIRKEELVSHLQRVKMDVADFDFSKYLAHCRALPPSECPFQSVRHWFAVGKHLCGGCTDLSLRCVAQCLGEFRGVAIATCCHHRCSEDTFVGSFDDFAVADVTGEVVFRSVCRVASWATSGDLADIAKVEVGWQVKRLIDRSRLRWLRGVGFGNARALHYVDASVSPENTVLVAFKSEDGTAES